MNGNTVFKNEYVKIFTINRDVFAETYKKAFSWNNCTLFLKISLK